MANICTYEMRIRGKKDDCYEMAETGLRKTYDYGYSIEDGTDADFILGIMGECPTSVNHSFIEDFQSDDFEDQTLIEKSKLLNLEIEVIGYDLSEPYWFEHYHYKKGEALHENCCSPIIYKAQAEYEMSEDNYPYEDGYEEYKQDYLDNLAQRYTFDNEKDIYVIKEEYSEDFSYDKEQMEMKYSMNIPDRC